MCQCTLPSYTLRGSMESCGSQSNCAIYTGRLLGSDTASATEVFEMVEDWLATQNGSLLNGALSIDPDCPLPRLSPSDAACSTCNKIIPSDDDHDGDVTLAQLLLISITSASVTVIVCSVIAVSAVCICRSRKEKKNNSLMSSIYAQPELEGNQRHYSIVVQSNPSYGHGKDRLKQCPSWNSELQNNTITNGSSIGSSEVTSGDHMTQSTYTMIRPRRDTSATTSSGYVDVCSSSEYCINDISSTDTSVSYLSITHT